MRVAYATMRTHFKKQRFLYILVEDDFAIEFKQSTLVCVPIGPSMFLDCRSVCSSVNLAVFRSKGQIQYDSRAYRATILFNELSAIKNSIHALRYI